MLKNIKLNIMMKLALTSCALMVGVVILGVGLGYFWASDLLRNTVSRDNVERSLRTLFSQGLGLTGILVLLAVFLSFLTSRIFAQKAKDLERAKEEFEKANAELKRLDEQKSDFISTVSHDLRTPLSITKEGISFVLDGVAGEINERQKGVLITSRNNIDRLTRIINSLLDFNNLRGWFLV